LNITGQDAFFLTFIAAWISVRINIWGQDKIAPLILLIMAIFFYTLFVGWLRDCLEEKKFINSTFFFIPLLGIFSCCMLMIGFASDYLKSSDLSLLISIGLLWLFITFLEKVNFNIDFTSRTSKREQSKDTTP